jgi:uncharacterized protein (TIGR02145 family)
MELQNCRLMVDNKRINPMRKLLLTTAAVAAAIGLAVAGEPSFGTFTDTRDGQTYKTVTIGTQTWMARNLNYKTDSSWCYYDSLSYCKKYGRLYDWKTATIVCPKGWKLPSNQEWGSLVTMAGGHETAGKTLKSKSGWIHNGNGTDDFGFSALSGGVYYGGGFIYVGYYGVWWTASDSNSNSNSDYANYRSMNSGNNYVRELNYSKNNGLSVRCAADRP